MRMVSFIEAVLMTIAFLFVFLVLWTDRTTQKAPVRRPDLDLLAARYRRLSA